MAYFALLIFPWYIYYFPEICASDQSFLNRNRQSDKVLAYFDTHLYHYLSVTKITSLNVRHGFECAFLCARKADCSSLNMAANPDTRGFYLCELLSTNANRATDKLHVNAFFHHYSPWVPCSCDNSICMSNTIVDPNEEGASFSCICHPGFAGILCERTARSCSEIKSHSSDPPDGTYIIDPDEEGGELPFTVYCDMRDMNGVGVTVISHDSESRTLVKGFKSPGSYVRNISYTGVTKISALVGLTQVSTSCEQFIRYECRGSVLYHTYNCDPPLPFGWWVSSDGSNMTYWGGMTSGDYKCACGLSNTCVLPGMDCNCDKNDDVWREDSGLLTNKSHLPVIQLRFGDTDRADEEGYHTLGKLKCFGEA